MSIKRMRGLGILAIVLLFAAGLWGAWPAVADPKPVADEGEILPYLEQVIAWQRQAAAVEPTLGSARESLLKDSLTQGTAHVLKFSFAFARTQADLIDKSATDTGAGDQDGDKARLQNASAKIAQHVTDLQDQIEDLTADLHDTPTRKRPPIQAQLDELNGQLKLAGAQQELIGNLLGVFNGMVNSANTGFLGKVNSLSDSVTQPDKPADAGAPKSETAAPATPAKTEAATVPSGGLLDIVGDLFKLWRQTTDLDALESGATNLRKTNKDFLDQLHASLRDAVKQGSSLGTAAPPAKAADKPPTDKPAGDAKAPDQKPAPAPQTLSSLLADFKQLSAAVVPVTQTNIWLDASIRTLDEWQKTVREEIETLLRRLAIRLSVLGGLILIPVVIADVIRRASERYIKDEKRLKQLRAIRRSLLTVIIVIIVLLNLVTEFGSFATFAGFLIGGLAVAFQNVLLSLVAFFFFYGRYSVRAGDRVSVSGVIGDVVHVGALRFYVRELENEEDKLKPTGRIAAFPNSILFQTSAFFKYV